MLPVDHHWADIRMHRIDREQLELYLHRHYDDETTYAQMLLDLIDSVSVEDVLEPDESLITSDEFDELRTPTFDELRRRIEDNGEFKFRPDDEPSAD